ncbi:hypothetical protein CVT25_002356 [Psilocybe cyanescens]|uniref:Uncharacterized protein n=1 Tax=Psilocybe cyanescens TaxID=93625 RepID=A0A409WKK6_PSICY|nr:hypothetical protein CVT25_002356 [Psilocybe cyanescens]
MTLDLAREKFAVHLGKATWEEVIGMSLNDPQKLPEQLSYPTSMLDCDRIEHIVSAEAFVTPFLALAKRKNLSFTSASTKLWSL